MRVKNESALKLKKKNKHVEIDIESLKESDKVESVSQDEEEQ